ncbi:MAG: hypothetical protein ACTSSJ_07765 [Candidatus Odinarchaeia archaeon]
MYSKFCSEIIEIDVEEVMMVTEELIGVRSRITKKYVSKKKKAVTESKSYSLPLPKSLIKDEMFPWKEDILENVMLKIAIVRLSPQTKDRLRSKRDCALIIYEPKLYMTEDLEKVVAYEVKKEDVDTEKTEV